MSRKTLKQLTRTRKSKKSVRGGAAAPAPAPLALLTSSECFQYKTKTGWGNFGEENDSIVKSNIYKGIFKFRLGNYGVDLEKMTQINLKTDKVRKIRMINCKSKRGIPLVISKKRCFQYELKAGWKNFSKVNQEKTIENIKNDNLNFRIGNYIFDIGRMTQENIKTGKIRRIRCVDCDSGKMVLPPLDVVRCLEYQTKKGSWIKFDKKSQQSVNSMLELDKNLKKFEFNISLPSGKKEVYKIDLNKMIQISPRGVVRKIRFVDC